MTHDSAVPIVHRGLVVVAENERGTGEGAVTAYDADRGTRRWSTPVDAEFGPRLWGDAAGADVVIADLAGSLIDVEVTSGRVRWVSDPVEPSDEAHPQIAGARVFLTPSNTGAVEIDRATGDVLGAGPLRPEVYVFDTAGSRVGSSSSWATGCRSPCGPSRRQRRSPPRRAADRHHYTDSSTRALVRDLTRPYPSPERGTPGGGLRAARKRAEVQPRRPLWLSSR